MRINGFNPLLPRTVDGQPLSETGSPGNSLIINRITISCDLSRLHLGQGAGYPGESYPQERSLLRNAIYRISRTGASRVAGITAHGQPSINRTNASASFADASRALKLADVRRKIDEGYYESLKHIQELADVLAKKLDLEGTPEN